MNELANSLNFIIKNEINKVLDNISINFNINRDELNIYTNLDEYEKDNNAINNVDNLIEIPDINTDNEYLENSTNSDLKRNDNSDIKVDNKVLNSNITNNIKCKQMTRKGKQCDYNCKPNSEYCGRHSK